MTPMEFCSLFAYLAVSQLLYLSLRWLLFFLLKWLIYILSEKRKPTVIVILLSSSITREYLGGGLIKMAMSRKELNCNHKSLWGMGLSLMHPKTPLTMKEPMKRDRCSFMETRFHLPSLWTAQNHAGFTVFMTKLKTASILSSSLNVDPKRLVQFLRLRVSG